MKHAEYHPSLFAINDAHCRDRSWSQGIRTRARGILEPLSTCAVFVPGETELKFARLFAHMFSGCENDF